MNKFKNCTYLKRTEIVIIRKWQWHDALNENRFFIYYNSRKNLFKIMNTFPVCVFYSFYFQHVFRLETNFGSFFKDLRSISRIPNYLKRQMKLFQDVWENLQFSPQNENTFLVVKQFFLSLSKIYCAVRVLQTFASFKAK